MSVDSAYTPRCEPDESCTTFDCGDSCVQNTNTFSVASGCIFGFVDAALQCGSTDCVTTSMEARLDELYPVHLNISNPCAGVSLTGGITGVVDGACMLSLSAPFSRSACTS